MKNDQLYIGHILDSIERIREYVAGRGRADFLEDRMLQDAVVRQLEIIGEASRRLSDEFKRSHPEVPWRDITAMRNRIVHDYLNVSLEIVWYVVEEDLPTLHAQLTMPATDPGEGAT